MKNNIFEYMNLRFDNSMICEKQDDILLPIYLEKMYELYNMDILEHKCLLVKVKKQITVENTLKHIRTISESAKERKVVLYFSKLNKSYINELISNNIPFIVDDKQLYLPFIFLDLKNNFVVEKKLERFSPLTQLTFLYFLYNDEQLDATSYAQRIGYSKMSTSRALNELYDLELLEYSFAGPNKRTKVYTRISRNYLRNGEEYLESPIIKKYYCSSNSDINHFGLKSGENALADVSMLSYSSDSIAIWDQDFKRHKDDIELKNDLRTDKVFEDDLTIEIWKYNPKILSKGNSVDLVSLSKTLDLNDVRVRTEVEYLLEGLYEL